MNLWVQPESIAEFLGGNPEGAMEVFAALAVELEDIERAERFARELAREHCGSLAHQYVAPFLRILADALEAAEAGQ